MNHAIFLDQPVRMNPRRQSRQYQAESEPLPSWIPHDSSTKSPQSSLSPWMLSKEFDAPLASRSPSSYGLGISPSILPHSLEQEQPMAEGPAASSPSTTFAHEPSPKVDAKTPTVKQRRTTKAACSACRKRKAKCDGKRPTCSSCTDLKRKCEYLAEEGISSQAASRKRLEGYATVLNLIRKASAGDCKNILDDLRGPKTMDKGVNTVLEKWQQFGTSETH
ncbi:hypothetical protein AUEXF2481DRAFT_450881 [Aureobasidium subglaciale EXF-2481]|uniref:Zn(2)-C6 fungal-type domain-containing protein n=1 Tax=Aureobasidium subglaciale (strain EXF-2481) TaxID=1043005 RepID=A0A074YY12_AURSE|nr:uncharacterized protein AUEXF2481DRAFT_450881 [Aureobasidium subglaciale EXF-2481]KEQ91756.1 hypothetical protein AUEXF2481DRAFT_450881 [Aureobasidium subglaciale EXF-2481]